VPPRFAYWTILAGGLPTAFRASEKEDLLPTFKRLLEKHPDAEMRWFARGKLWASPEESRAGTEPRVMREPSGKPRGRDWRPGGEHRDARQSFKDAKREKNQVLRKERFERKHGPPRAGAGAGHPPGARAVVPPASASRPAKPWSASDRPLPDQKIRAPHSLGDQETRTARPMPKPGPRGTSPRSEKNPRAFRDLPEQDSRAARPLPKPGPRAEQRTSDKGTRSTRDFKAHGSRSPRPVQDSRTTRPLPPHSTRTTRPLPSKGTPPPANAREAAPPERSSRPAAPRGRPGEPRGRAGDKRDPSRWRR